MLVAFAMAIGLALAEVPEGLAQAADARSAQEALRAAEDAVRRATQARSLWTTAQEALEQARSAAARGDYVQAEQRARFAREQAELGIAQARLPRLNE
jgi:hypothetical protein